MVKKNFFENLTNLNPTIEFSETAFKAFKSLLDFFSRFRVNGGIPDFGIILQRSKIMKIFQVVF